MKPVVIITGLPYFASKVCRDLQTYDRTVTYIFLNTYYRKFDQLKYLVYIWFARTVYSINGALGGSRVLTLAVRLKKKVVMHWVGSDLVEAQRRMREHTARKELIQWPTHLTDTPWYVEPLSALGIRAAYFPLLSIGEDRKLLPFPDQFTVAAYIPDSNPDFYGFNALKAAADSMPDTLFLVAGLSPSVSLPPNMEALGWVDHMESVFARAVVVVRMPQHDGLSIFVLEALAHGRYVLYNQPYAMTTLVLDSQALLNKLIELRDEFQRGALATNQAGHQFVAANFSKATMLLKLKHLLA